MRREGITRLRDLDLPALVQPPAVAWLERFEAYYRVWAPVSGIGGDLTPTGRRCRGRLA